MLRGTNSDIICFLWAAVSVETQFLIFFPMPRKEHPVSHSEENAAPEPHLDGPTSVPGDNVDIGLRMLAQGMLKPLRKAPALGLGGFLTTDFTDGTDGIQRRDVFIRAIRVIPTFKI